MNFSKAIQNEIVQSSNRSYINMKREEKISSYNDKAAARKSLTFQKPDPRSPTRQEEVSIQSDAEAM